MIVHECQQGSDEWHSLRLAMPTASQFHRIITPKTGKPSAQAFGYLCECAAEWMLGEPLDAASSQWMERGRKQEEEAIRWYKCDHDCEARGIQVRSVGFVTDDANTVGCSPDALVGDDGGLEIKVPAAKTHVGYMIRPETLVAAYRTQVQGSLWITGYEWWDLLSYNPAMEAVEQRVERDEKLIATFAELVPKFVQELHEVLVRFKYRD